MALIEFSLDVNEGATKLYFEETKKLNTAGGCVLASEVVVGQRLYTCDGAACKVASITVVV